ncbi:hypothetical protein [Salinirubrum litoreum]|uniref:Serine/threonine protein kinase n=1 Tax=Salinirubrum litoreum TaxID=1126234 RepID=A0ABD5R9C6_9EURY|nr:hypothetical protein [Salinirubrum litoreum]
MSSNSSALAVLLAGIVLGGVLGVGFATVGEEPGTVTLAPPDPEAPPASASWGGPQCLTDAPANAGWIATGSQANSRFVTVNATLAHDRDQQLAEPRVQAVGDRRYRIVFSFRDAERGDAPPDCPVGSHATVSASLPSDFRSVTVLVGERPIRTLERPETTTVLLYPLADPVNATA